MTDFLLDADGDISLTDSGDFELVTDAEAVGQHLQMRLLTFLGEWFLDKNVGVPYFQKIFGKKAKFATTRSILRAVVATTPGIKTIEEFTFDSDRVARVLSLTCQGLLDDSTEYTFEYTELKIGV
ncbi:MAG: hypothetical protein JRD89_01425 [Deltaproteobacteria bacterium]|nr:hypothetical protein [Deltaproteobacteria bacterium]